MNETLQTVQSVQSAVTATHQVDMSLWALFWQADSVVKLVMLSLILASVWSWGVFIDKYMRMRVLNKQADDFESAFWRRASLLGIVGQISNDPKNPLEALFVAALTEWKRWKGTRADAAMKLEKVERAMGLTYSREVDALSSNLNFLATVASISVFVGLFGTVWGIIDSFQAIAMSKNTNLAVVAPGIAESLFATALGLLAAIPAKLFYNNMSIEINKYAARMEMFAGELQAAIDQEMERGEGV